MKNKLPKLQFPNIFRFITEKVDRSLNHLAKLGVVFAFTAITFLILALGFDLFNNYRTKVDTENKKKALISQINYWQELVKRDKGYRDGYFMLAVLEYQIKDFQNSKEYLNRTLLIDPNFTPAQDLQKILDRKVQ